MVHLRRLSVGLAFCLLTLAACAAPEARTVAVGQAFDLAVDESVGVAGQLLRLGLVAVLADSRCPRGERCVHAGEAQVQLWFQQGSAPRQVRDLVHRPGGASTPMPWPGTGLEIRFVDLQPGPVSGRTAAMGDYRAWLKLEPYHATASQH